MPFLQKKSVQLTFSSRRTANCKVPSRIGGHHFLLCQQTNTKDKAGQSANITPYFRNNLYKINIIVLLYHYTMSLLRCYRVVLAEQTRKFTKEKLVREGCKKNPEKVWSIAKPPSAPPPCLAFFPNKNFTPIFLLKIASLIAETSFTLGRTSKTNKICFGGSIMILHGN